VRPAGYDYIFSGSFYTMTRTTVVCKARSLTRKIPVEHCVPNPVHPACKQCNSPKIAQMKPEDQVRLRSQDAKASKDDKLLLEDSSGFEPDEDDFEELKED
jgi:hypothetical protein